MRDIETASALDIALHLDRLRFNYPVPKRPTMPQKELEEPEKLRTLASRIEEWKQRVKDYEDAHKTHFDYVKSTTDVMKQKALSDCFPYYFPIYLQDRVWSLSNERRHSDGYRAVVEHLFDISDLYIECYNAGSTNE